MYLIMSKFVRLGLLHELSWSGFPSYDYLTLLSMTISQ